jgi:hypothetical protein
MDVLKAVEGVDVTEYKHSASFRIEGKENTWSRSARRKRKRRKLEAAEVDLGQDSTSKLVCDVRIIRPENAALDEDPKSNLHVDPTSGTSVEGAEWTGLEVGEEAEGNGSCEHEHIRLQANPGYSLECQWIFGADHRDFESLVGHIGRKLIECIHPG